mgnify:CR=1 FL=1
MNDDGTAHRQFTLEAIAAKSGYSSVQAFSRAFHADYGMPPARYRNEGHGHRVIIDGPVRDTPRVRELELPVYARAITPMAGNPATGNLIAATRGNAPTLFGLDVFGSPINSTNQPLADATGWDAYGNPTGATAGNTKATFGYRGELTVLGDTNLRARSYDSRTGQFTSVDPLDDVPGTPTSGNRYHYTNNNPTNLTDPSGQRPDEPESTPARRLTPAELASIRTVLLAQRAAMACTKAASSAPNGVFGVTYTPLGDGNCGVAGRTCTGGGVSQWGCEHEDGLLDVLQAIGSMATAALCEMVPAGAIASGGVAAACGGAANRYMSAIRSGSSPTEAIGKAFDAASLARDAIIGMAMVGALKVGQALLKKLPVDQIMQRLRSLSTKATRSVDDVAGSEFLDDTLRSVEQPPLAKRPPKASPNFQEPTNPPQLPPDTVAPGHSIRRMGPTSQYPDGYWVETNAAGQPVNPATGKPPSNVTRAQARAQTHVPLPPQ